MTTAEEILNRKGGGTRIEEFLGQTLTIVDAQVSDFTTPDGVRQKVTAQIVTSEGKEADFNTSAQAVVGKIKDLKAGGFLPIEVRVTSYPGQFGKLGFDISPV